MPGKEGNATEEVQMRPTDPDEQRHRRRPRLLALAVALLAVAATFVVSAPANAAPATGATIRCPEEPCDPPPPPELSLTVDRVRYQVGQSPLYTVRNAAPDTPIYWSSFRNGVSTGEVNSFYGHYTNSAGFFRAYGGAWTTDNIGDWVKEVSIGGDVASVSFKVVQSCGYTFLATKVFSPDERYDGCKGTFIMQADGNLVIYDEFNRARFSSGTAGYPGAYAVFQDDGNLVVYTSWGYPLWASNTYAPGGRLVFQDDGNLVIYNAFGGAVWASNTGH
jgi:hypothetical protein